MRLSQVCDLLDVPTPPDFVDQRVTGVSYDSRRVEPGHVFVAIRGFHVDGIRFVSDALLRGARLAIVNDDGEAGALPADAWAGGRIVRAPDTRAALAALAAEYFDRPADSIFTIGVTGTDGKTTTSYLISALLEHAGLATGLFSTVAYKVGPVWEYNDSRQTTPEALEVQQLLRRMVDAGARYAVLESTSHGLELHKLDHCQYDLAVFTNLSPDHLDFHRTVEAYRAAKARLFAMLDTAIAKGIPKVAILNADDASSGYMAARCKAEKLWYGIESAADVRVSSMDVRADGTRIAVRTPSGNFDTFLPLPGRFNVYNALAAAAVGLTQGVSPNVIGEALAAVEGIPGRMQRIDVGQPFTVIVDYAHTEAAFRKVAQTVRPLTSGRLIAVFGCAGERGAERRTGMGRAAATLADYAVLTTEDPRAEDPEAIIGDIADAMAAAGAIEGRSFERIVDRRLAIARAFDLARPGDVVLLTGKGHEHSIETAAGRLPWDEAAVARELLA